MTTYSLRAVPPCRSGLLVPSTAAQHQPLSSPLLSAPRWACFSFGHSKGEDGRGGSGTCFSSHRASQTFTVHSVFCQGGIFAFPRHGQHNNARYPAHPRPIPTPLPRAPTLLPFAQQLRHCWARPVPPVRGTTPPCVKANCCGRDAPGRCSKRNCLLHFAGRR